MARLWGTVAFRLVLGYSLLAIASMSVVSAAFYFGTPQGHRSCFPMTEGVMRAMDAIAPFRASPAGLTSPPLSFCPIAKW